MARSRGLVQLISYFTLSVSLLLLILALSSHQATASSSSLDSATESITTMFETGRSIDSWWGDWWKKITHPKDWFKKPLRDILYFLNKIRVRIIDESLKIFKLPTTGDLFHYFVVVIKWLTDKLYYFLSDPKTRIETAINWIVDSALNPFRTLTDGIQSFRRLFRYLHQLSKGTYADFGKNHPVFKCYNEFYPWCVKDTAYSIGSFLTYHFWCAWLFYERCQLRYWWENGQWKVPRLNGGDACKVLPWDRCRGYPKLP